MDAFIPKFLASLWKDNPLPDGVNRWDEPLNGRTPVILIHGTWLNAYNTWDMIARELISAGHAVFALNYGKSTDPYVGRAPGVYANDFLRNAQQEVAEFIREVMERTGAEQVNLVGHSQGVAQARMFTAESYRLAPESPNPVRHLVGLGPVNDGTTLSGISTLGDILDRNHRSYPLLRKILGGCAEDQAKGSDFNDYLNQDGHTVPQVDYTMIISPFDGIATPPRKQVMTPGEGATVHNIRVQEHGNVLDWSSHLSMLYSDRVVDLVKEALHPDEGGREAYRRANPYRRGVVVPMMGAIHRPKRFRKR